jgi:hypothetical protein
MSVSPGNGTASAANNRKKSSSLRADADKCTYYRRAVTATDSAIRTTRRPQSMGQTTVPSRPSTGKLSHGSWFWHKMLLSQVSNMHSLSDAIGVAHLTTPASADAAVNPEVEPAATRRNRLSSEPFQTGETHRPVTLQYSKQLHNQQRALPQQIFTGGHE